MRSIIAILVFCTLLVFSNSVAAARDQLVFAAASMREAMLQIGAAYEVECRCNVRFSFAASSALARQIDAGAPADVFVSANRRWMEWLHDKQLLAGAPQVIARNRLVIASRSDGNGDFDILKRGRFAMGDPVGVPAGIYAKEALVDLGLWEEVQENAVYTTNVRVALAMISRGDLDAAIVYASDLKAEPTLTAQMTFPEASHSPIEYMAGDIRGAGGDFLEFVSGKAAQTILTSAGFLPASP